MLKLRFSAFDPRTFRGFIRPRTAPRRALKQLPRALQPAISVGEQVRAGKAVGLAVASPERNPTFADIPTFVELGYPAVQGVSWFWLAGPKNIPTDIVMRLNSEVRRIVRSPKIKEQFSSNGLSTIDVDVAGLNEVVAKEVMLWGALAKDVGLTVQ